MDCHFTQRSSLLPTHLRPIHHVLNFFGLWSGLLITVPFLCVRVLFLFPTDTEIAPLWDPERRVLVGMMTISDYIRALQLCLQQGYPVGEMAAKSIAEIAALPALTFRHPDFQSIDAEDSVYQLYMLLERLGTDFVPVINPDDGNIVSVLGYLDIAHLLNEAAKQHPHSFPHTVDQVGNFVDVVTAPRSAKLADVVAVIEQRNLIGIPITDESGQLVGIYHRSDVGFATRAADPQGMLQNLSDLSVGEALAFSDQQLQSGDQISKVYVLVKCSPTDHVTAVVEALLAARISIAVCVNEANVCVGTISLRDILRYFVSGRSVR